MLLRWTRVSDSDWSVSCIILYTFACEREWRPTPWTVQLLWNIYERRQKKKTQPFRVCVSECTLVFIHEQAHTIYTHHTLRSNAHASRCTVCKYVHRWQNGRYLRPHDNSEGWIRHYCIPVHQPDIWILLPDPHIVLLKKKRKEMSLVSGAHPVARLGSDSPKKREVRTDQGKASGFNMTSQEVWTNSSCWLVFFFFLLLPRWSILMFVFILHRFSHRLCFYSKCAPCCCCCCAI